MNALRNLFSSVSTLYTRMAPRERALLSVLAAIGSFYLLLSAMDWSAAAEERAVSAATEHQQAEHLAVLARDTTYQAAASKQVALLRNVSFVASTISIAKADAQAALRSIGESSGIEDLAVSLSPQEAASARLGLQTLTVEGKFDWGSMLRFCDSLAGSRQAVIITGLGVTGGRTPRFRLTLVASLASQEP